MITTRKKAGYVQRKDGRLQKRIVYEGRTYYVYGRSYKECDEKEEALKKKLALGLVLDKERITLSEYYQEWQENRVGSVKPSTQGNNNSRWTSIAEAMGHLRLSQITPRHIKALQTQFVQAGLKTVTINRKIGLLSTVLQSAVYDKIIASNPCDRVPKLQNNWSEPAAAETIHRALEDWETELFLEAAKDTWYYDFYRFMLLTGCRCGEVAALEWGDINYKAGFIRINKTVTKGLDKKPCIGEPKTKSSIRQIPLTRPVIEVLEAQKIRYDLIHEGIAPIHDRRIFVSMNGTLVTTSGLCAHVKYLIDKINATSKTKLDHFGSHAFRDTYATKCIEQGMNPNTLKKILGHSSLALTMDLYAHVMPATMKREAEMVSII